MTIKMFFIEGGVAKPELPFHALGARHPGVTQALGESYTEAARVCLERHHSSPIDIVVSNENHNIDSKAQWEKCDDRLRAAYANEIDATEAGAYACALAAVELAQELFAIGRAETKTGADYYVAPIGNLGSFEDLESSFRLEVSGLDKGDDNAIFQRLKTKIKQAQSGNSNLPAIAAVVGFRARKILIQSVEQV